MSDVTQDDEPVPELASEDPGRSELSSAGGDDLLPESEESPIETTAPADVAPVPVEVSPTGPEPSEGDSPADQAPPTPQPEPEMTEAEREKALEAGLGRSDSRWKDVGQHAYLKQVLESLLFVSDKIITRVHLARIVRAKPALVRTLLDEIIEEYSGRGIQLAEVSGGYQFRSAPQSGRYVRELVAQKPVRLTRAQLETLALVAYRQPITRPEIDDVRGVDTGSAVKVLLDRGLIKMLGRKDEAGRPLLYGTTPFFLEFFGLKGLKDLPTLKEFTELSDDSRVLFKRKTGEAVDGAEVEASKAETEVADTSDVHKTGEPPSDADVEDEGADVEDDGADVEGDGADVEGDGADVEDDGADVEDDGADGEPGLEDEVAP